MSFERPTLLTLINRAIADIETRLSGADARLRRSFENVIARVVAGAAHSLHGHLVYLARQVFPDTAESVYLRRWASVWGVAPKDPAKAGGPLTITGVATTVVPAGTAWTRGDGAEFVTTTDNTIGGGGSVVATLEASEAGADGNTDTGTTLSIVTPIADVDSSGISGEIENGTDAELDADLLVRLLLRIRTPPTGGGPEDYVKWALEVSGVTRAWEFPAEYGLGTVTIRFMVDGEVDPIPNSAKVAEVDTYIETKAPITAGVYTIAPVATPLNPEISITPDTAAVRTAVEAELEALLIREAAPGATLYLSQINEAISIASGETDHTLVSPVADVTHITGKIPTLGTITWS